MEIEKILEERNKEYGDFSRQAEISQKIKLLIIGSCLSYESKFSPSAREALEMIIHKISRIVNGNPSNIDSWRDICGYSQLVVNRLEKESAK